MAWYSDNGLYPQPLLPWRIRLPDGKTRTDPSQFTPEDLALAGFFEVEPPPVTTQTQQLNWDGKNWVITEITVNTDV